MKVSFKSVRWASIIIVLVSTILASSLILVQLSNHNVQNELAEYAQDTLGKSISNGGLRFAIASNDFPLIKKIIHGYIESNEIYALEIVDPDGNSIYREEKFFDSEITIDKKSFIILPPFDDLKIDEFVIDSGLEVKPLGMINIYFSNGDIHQKIQEHTQYISLIMAMVIIFITGSFLAFNYYNDRALKRTLLQTIKSKNQAEKAETYKDDFIRAITHDINTPVFAVVNLIDFIRRETKDINLSESTKEKIEACYHSSQILSSVTRELFDFEQFQNQSLIEHKENIVIGDLFIFFDKMYQSKFAQSNVNFKLKKPDNDSLNTTICIDHKKITRAVSNLLDNAYKFTHEGIVVLSWSIKGDVLYVSVKDSGIGMSKEKIDRVFDKHTQLEDSITNRFQGRGLGLYYVRCLLDAIDGNVTVSSSEGFGSNFELTFPITYSESKYIEPIETFNMKGTTALIIDDDEDTCVALKAILEDYGIASRTESIPELGLRQLIDDTPDLVFIDYHMPNLSGNVLLAKAKGAGLSKDPIFICITAEADKSTIDKLAEDFRVVMKKSFSKSEIHSVLEIVHQAAIESENIISTIMNAENSDKQ